MNKQFFPKYVLSNCSSHIYIYIYRCGGFTEYGYPKSCILIGFSLINHPFWGFLRYPHLRGPFGRVFPPSKKVFPCTLDTVAVVSIYIYIYFCVFTPGMCTYMYYSHLIWCICTLHIFMIPSNISKTKQSNHHKQSMLPTTYADLHFIFCI